MLLLLFFIIYIMSYEKKWDNTREFIIEYWYTNSWNDVKHWAKKYRPEEYDEAEKQAINLKKKQDKKLQEDKKNIKSLDNKNAPKIYRIPFDSSKIKVKKEIIKNLIKFCYGIDVKNTRSGGSEIRNQEKKRYDNLQGKLAEIILYELYCDKYDLEDIDFNLYKLGEWDSFDIISTKLNLNINVKSGLNFHNLLLLTAKDYVDDGNYKHHKHNTEHHSKQLFSFVRLKINKDKIIKMFSNNVNDFSEWFLKEYQTIEYDLFFCDINKVSNAIKMNNLIKKGEFLNDTEMDADNYYLLTYNMYETIDELI